MFSLASGGEWGKRGETGCGSVSESPVTLGSPRGTSLALCTVCHLSRCLQSQNPPPPIY